MNGTSVPLTRVTNRAARPSGWAVGVPATLAAGAALGGVIAHQPLLALVVCALAVIVLAVPWVESLCALSFWLLPYLILNLPAGGLTLKVPEVTAYLFMAATLTRAVLRRERISLPPATPQVLVYLAVLATAACLAPAIPGPHRGDFGLTTGADYRAVFVLFWLAVSWLVVGAFYHVAGTSAVVFRRCLRAHIAAGGLSSLVGLVGYAITIRGVVLGGIGHSHSFIADVGSDLGSYYRLTGVSYEPLLLAFYLLSVIPVTIVVVLFRPEVMRRQAACLSLTLQVIAFVLTFSAGGWAALLVSLAVMVLLLRPRRVSPRLAGALVATGVLLSVALAGVYVVSPIVNRVVGSTIGKITGGGYKERNDEIVTGMAMFHDHPFLGVGTGMIPFYFAVYHPTIRTTDTSKNLLISNLYVATLAETGLVGFAALGACGIAGVTVLGRAIRRAGPRHVPVLTALTASLAGCVVQFWESQNLFLIYFPALVGLAVAAARLARDGGEQP